MMVQLIAQHASSKKEPHNEGDITVIHHETNLGYGAALATALLMHSNLVKMVRRVGTVW
jgi:imidazoleglycerol phosphate dehydratase HisB